MNMQDCGKTLCLAFSALVINKINNINYCEGYMAGIRKMKHKCETERSVACKRASVRKHYKTL